jgi:RNA polymerase sigma factor (sigma-70 family)
MGASDGSLAIRGKSALLLTYEDRNVDNENMEAARTRAPLAADGASAPSRYVLRLASDAKLVGRVRAGSEQAFAVLFERHYRGILSFCRHMLGSREEGEDVVQQVFANAYADMLRSDKELNFKPWLYRIARNQCISALRARHHDVELSSDEPSLVGLSEQVAQRDQLRTMLEDLAELPVEQREALVLAELHDNSHVEVAEILGCEREKVKSLVFQARSSLIKSREARDLPCEEVRRQLSVLTGGALRRNTIRRHLQHCEGCRAFRQEVKQQRQALAVILPVMPSAALKFGAANAMAAAGVATAAMGGGAAAGTAGPLAALAGKVGVSTAAMKTAAAAVAVTVAAGGGAVAVKEVREPSPARQPAAERPAGVPSAPGGALGAGSAAASGGQAARHRQARSREARARARERMRNGSQGRGAGLGTAGRTSPLSLAPGERARRKAAKKQKLRRSGRVKRHKRLETEKPVRSKPSPLQRDREAPTRTTPTEPAPTDPASDGTGTTFP